MSAAPTVEDVARAAGVSRQTVSNVLNNPDIVRPPTRERVLRAIDDLGYRRHAAARMLRTRRSSTIGIHLDPYAGGISGVVLDRFVHALTEQASARGMRVLVYSARTPAEEIERLGDLADGGEVDAVVLTGTDVADPRSAWLRSRGLPFVSFGRPWGESPDAFLWVDVDGAVGTRAATEHALSVGAMRIAFLGWPKGSGTGDERERGWRETLAERGLKGPRFSVEEGVAPARAAMQRLLADTPIDALVCVSDATAVGAHLAAIEAGMPTLPIIGFDNTPVVEAMGLSSVEQLPERVAVGALELLMGPVGDVVAPREQGHVLVEPRLVVRDRDRY